MLFMLLLLSRDLLVVLMIVFIVRVVMLFCYILIFMCIVFY